MRNLKWFAPLVLAAGCATFGQKNEQPSQTVTAQNTASQSLQSAADAQKRATEEQQKAEQAHQNVIEAQKQLAQAEAVSRAQQARAEQAQADARRLEQVAHEQGAVSQQDAAQKMQEQAQQNQQTVQQNMQWTQSQDVQGSLIGASGNSVALRTSDSQTLNLKVNDATNVTLDGQAANLSQLQPGADVRASYQMIDGQPQALKITAQTRR